MTNNFKHRFLCQAMMPILGLFYTPWVAAQDIQNVDFTVQNEKIIVVYDLVNCTYDRSYDVKLYYTDQTGFSEAISVEGNLIKQSCGKQKVITWDVLKDKKELKGKIQLEVKIVRSYSMLRKAMIDNDKGLIGVSFSYFNPIGSFGVSSAGIPSDKLDQRGNSIDILLALRLKGFFGVTGNLRFSNTMRYVSAAAGDTYWANHGFTVGPWFSFPLSTAVFLDLRPLIGYSHTFTYPSSNKSIFFENGFGLDAGAFTKNFGAVLRYNWDDTFYYFVGADYFSANPRFNSELTRNLKTLGFSIGASLRLN